MKKTMKETKKFVENQANFIIGCALDSEWSISKTIRFAKDYLGQYDYTEKFVDKVCKLVVDELMPTKRN